MTKQMYTVTIRNKEGKWVKEKQIEGESVPNQWGLDVFIHKSEYKGEWRVTETTTGAFLAEGKTKKATIDEFTRRVNTWGIDKVYAAMDYYKGLMQSQK